MKRAGLLSCVCLLACALGRAEDPAARQFEVLKEEHRKALQTAAPERGERQQTVLQQIFALAQKEPKSAVAVEALIWVAVFDDEGVLRPRAWDFLKKTYVNDPRLGPGLEQAVGSPSGMGHVQDILKASRNRTVKGFATLAVADWLQRNAREEGSRERMLADAERLAGDVLANYADVRRGASTLGEAAAAIQERIRRKLAIAIGKVAPDIAGEDAHGKPLKLSDFRGKVVLLKFWGNWCPPCRAMLPYERAVSQRLEKRPFTLLGVNTDKDRQELKNAVKQHRITWPSFFDGGTRGPICQEWEINAFPTIYLIDHAGVIRQKWVGAPGEKTLDQEIDKLVKEAEAGRG